MPYVFDISKTYKNINYSNRMKRKYMLAKLDVRQPWIAVGKE